MPTKKKENSGIDTKQIRIFHCSDKEKGAREQDPENLFCVPDNFVMGIIAQPSSGKSSLIKNIILNKCDKKYDEIYLYHYDPTTTEYMDIDYIQINAPSEFLDMIKGCDRKIRRLLIIEDIDVRTFKNKIEKSNLDRICGYVSTHCNTSIIISVQQAFAIVPSIRRMISIIIIINNYNDKTSVTQLSKYLGVDGDIHKMMKEYCKTKYEFMIFSNGYPRIRYMFDNVILE
jgi:ABC-type cobalamin/Fe3+-siderophores transport system ATPase subunit